MVVTELPRDLPILERDVVRLVVHDTLDQILLLHTHEPTAPELGQWWELPGGGINPGETYRQAASTDQFYPRRLPRLLTRFLDGDTITEPLEVWA